jgi:hypothetical protein
MGSCKENIEDNIFLTIEVSSRVRGLEDQKSQNFPVQMVVRRAGGGMLEMGLMARRGGNSDGEMGIV